MTTDDLIVALVLAISIEGIAYALFPDAMKRMMSQVLEQPSGAIRTVGLVAASCGVLILWLVRG